VKTLVEILDASVNELLVALNEHPIARRLLAGDVNTQEYGAFLEQTYLYVCQTRPLLRRAGERLAMQRRSPTLSRLFLQKAEEEAGHELWVLADLDAIGLPMNRDCPPQPSTAVAAYLAWNQFQVEAGWPLGFLGTAYVLEALADARAGKTATNLIEKNLIPGIRDGVRFLQGHADADEGHIEVLRRLLSVVSSPQDQEAIALSAEVTTALYLGMFSALENVEQSRQAA
jgi:pyrroloquinoline quinone (PQQ) biosynthesis protein C